MNHLLPTLLIFSLASCDLPPHSRVMRNVPESDTFYNVGVEGLPSPKPSDTLYNVGIEGFEESPLRVTIGPMTITLPSNWYTIERIGDSLLIRPLTSQGGQ